MLFLSVTRLEVIEAATTPSRSSPVFAISREVLPLIDIYACVFTRHNLVKKRLHTATLLLLMSWVIHEFKIKHPFDLLVKSNPSQIGTASSHDA